MKKKILFIITLMFAAIMLVACGGKKHNIKLVEKDTLVLWTAIDIHFTIEGEDEEHSITPDSIEGIAYLNNKPVTSKNATYNSNDEYYTLKFSSLKLDTEYEIVITASINRQKVVLYKEKLKTLLDGGDVNNPILINSVEDWKQITNKFAFYKLETDLDFNGEELFEPFKKDSSGNDNGLRGGFDGNGHTIKNFTIDYQNFNGIFGNMNQGTAKVSNLTVSDVNYNNYPNIENKVLTSLYSGLITKELAQAATIENITLKNIDAKLYTETYGIRYFGLITASNRGTIKDITLEDVNMEVILNTSNESIIGGVVGKNYAAAHLSKVNFASGSFTVSASEYQTNPKTVYATYIGAIVGESNGTLKEVYNGAALNIKDQNLVEDEVYYSFEGQNFEVKLDEENGFKAPSNGVVKSDQEVKVKLNPATGEELSKLLVNGVDKSLDVVGNILTITPSDKSIVVQVIYKNIDESELLKVTGTKFKLYLEDGKTEAPTTDLEFGTKLVVVGEKDFGHVTYIKVNGVAYPAVKDKIEFTIEKDSQIQVLSASSKTIYIGGIVGASSNIDNVVFAGSIDFNIKSPFKYHETYRVSALSGRSYVRIKNSAVIGVDTTINTQFNDLRTINFNTVTSDGKNIMDVAVVNGSILLDGVAFDDGNTIETSLREGIITSEFILDLLN